MRNKTASILLIEDNPGDIELTKEAFSDKEIVHKIEALRDGEQAMRYLRKEGEFSGAATPDIILLDLNLPKKDGRTILREIKQDDALKHIPVIILTTSSAEDDILTAYKNYANCYIRKPVDMDEFVRVAQKVEEFWLLTAQLP